MHCRQDYPLWKTVYNLVMLDGFLASGSIASASLGAWGLGGFLGATSLGFVVAVSTTCSHCSYYGRACGLGLGKLVPLLRRPSDPSLFARTPWQYWAVALLGTAPVLGSAGALRMLTDGMWLWPALYMASLLALLLPHPTLICRHCRQRERGLCPIGRTLVRAPVQ